jgi:hypothetical protein
VQELEALGLLTFQSGIGRGKRGSYVFTELENRTPQSSFSEIKQDRKQDNPQPVRSIEVDLTKPKPLQDQNLTDDAVYIPASSDFDFVTRTPQSGFVDRVIRAFEESPITTGKAKQCDMETALELQKLFTPEQIEYGILLAGARRVKSSLDDVAVQTLAYFRGAIEEGTQDEPHASTYVQYLHQVLRRFARKQPQSATA